MTVQDNAELASHRDPSSTTPLAGINGGGRGIEQADHCRQTYESGAILYHESERYKGLFQLARGRVKLSTSSSSGRAAIMKFAEAGELLGLTEAFANCPYLTTAEVMERSEVVFTSPGHLIQTLSRRDMVGQIIAQLSTDCSRMLQELRAHRLSFTASQRLAQLLLDLHERQMNSNHNGMIQIPYTHTEIAQLIGCSRETVTRLFQTFQEKKLLEMDRSKIYHAAINKLRQLVQL